LIPWRVQGLSSSDDAALKGDRKMCSGKENPYGTTSGGAGKSAGGGGAGVGMGLFGPEMMQQVAMDP
jgi:hypothetical protein